MPERSSWPVIARPEMIDEICRDLLSRPPRTALVTGIAGAGKTTLLEELGGRLRARRRVVVTVVGIAELATVPLGAFLPLLARASDADAPVEARLRSLLDRLGRDADRVVLLVDDAAHLDDVSAAAVYQLIRVFGVPALLTVRSGNRLPPALDRLHHEGSLHAHALPALTHEQTGELLTRRLGAAPTPELTNSLWARTEGNPLFLRGLVEGALARGARHTTAHGVEVEVADVADVGALADRTVRELDPGERRAAQLLSLTAGLDAEELARAGVDDHVRRLGAAGLTTRAADGRIRLVHPLIADAARRSLSDDRIERIRETAELLTDGDAARRLAAVRLLLDADADPGPARLADAATTAARAGDHPACVELARAAIDAGGSDVSLHWTLAHSLSLLGRLDEADAAFADGWTNARDPEDRALGAARNGEHLAFRRHDLAAAIALADREAARLPEALRASLDPEVRIWRAIAGELARPTDAAPDGSPLPADAPPAMRVRGAMAAVLTASLAGRGSHARASAATIAAIDREFGAIDPVASAMVHLEEFFHHLARADGASAWHAVASRRAGPATDAAGIWSYTLGVYCWYDGRLDEGERLAALAVDQLRWRDPTGLLGAAVVLHALFAQALGHDEQAERLLAALVPAQLGEPRAAVLHAEYAASRLAAAGRDTEAAELLRAVGTGAVDGGYALVGALTMSFAIRLGRPDTVREGLALAADAADVDNRLLPALRDLAAAVAEGDADAAIGAAQTVAAAGMRATARDALLRTASTDTLGEIARRRLGAAARAYDPIAPAEDPPTSREQEVARLAAQRLSNAEIAAELRVSVRTVENHLTRYYAKTGSTRRRLREEFSAEG